MKKVITPVGLSLFNNFFKHNSNCSLKDDFEGFKGDANHLYTADEYEKYKDDLQALKKAVFDFAVSHGQVTAEMSSLVKIQAIVKDDLEIYLLSTDTILSFLTAKILKDVFIEKYSQQSPSMKVKKIEAVKGLRVEKRKTFEQEGVVGLINMIDNMAEGYYGNVIFNMTGGYKAIIPYLTIMAQINSVPLYYTFEDTEGMKEELLRIPQAPIDIKWELFEEYWEQFSLLEGGDIRQKSEFTYPFLEQTQSSCLEIDGNDVALNPLGAIFWNSYKTKYFVFYAPDDVWEEIQTQPDILRILKEKFSDPQKRANKTEIKAELEGDEYKHLVYDDGNNDNRIYYFQEQQKIYIYKTFESEEDARRFIRQSKRKNYIIQTSQVRKLKK